MLIFSLQHHIMVPPTASFTPFPAACTVKNATAVPLVKQVAHVTPQTARLGREDYKDEYVFADIKEHMTARAMTSR